MLSGALLVSTLRGRPVRMDNSKSIRAGVDDAVFFWMSQHPVSMADFFKDSIEAAVTKWVDEHSDEIVAAIANAIKEAANAERAAVDAMAKAKLPTPR